MIPNLHLISDLTAGSTSPKNLILINQSVWDAQSHGTLPAAADENKSSRTQSVVPAGKGVAIPCSGECPKPFSEMAFIGIGMQHACIAHQSMSKGYSYIKLILSIDDN